LPSTPPAYRAYAPQMLLPRRPFSVSSSSSSAPAASVMS
jgi:hypothetical protein